MKRILSGVLLAVFVFVVSSEALAQVRRDVHFFKGKLAVVSYDRMEVTVRDGAGNDRKFTLKAPLDTSLQVGSQVVVMHKIGSNVASWIRPPRRKS